jgi:hypothetical protein
MRFRIASHPASHHQSELNSDSENSPLTVSIFLLDDIDRSIVGDLYFGKHVDGLFGNHPEPDFFASERFRLAQVWAGRSLC